MIVLRSRAHRMQRRNRMAGNHYHPSAIPRRQASLNHRHWTPANRNQSHYAKRTARRMRTQWRTIAAIADSNVRA